MRLRRSTLLVVAFATLLVIIEASAFAIWINTNNAQARVEALHSAHLEAGNALASIRANVYLSGVVIRDFLLDPDATHAPQYVEQFTNIRKATAENFRVLFATAQDDHERSSLELLRRELDAHWDPSASILSWSAEEKNLRRSEFLGERTRQRDEIVALAGQVELLMTANFTRARERSTNADAGFRSTLAWTTGLAILLGLGVAGVTLARMITLEQNYETSESELRRLSGQVRTAQEQERRFLSRELHDQVGQMLTGLRMELSIMARIDEDGESRFSSRIAHAKNIVEQTLGVVRNIAMLLRPSMLDDLGLEPALAWLVKEVSRSSGIEIQTDIDSALDSLPDSHRTCLYRVVQEALTNAARHSQAKRVQVSLKSSEEAVSASIVDDGRGFDTSQDRRDGLGLVGMQERVRELGGNIRVVSVPGQGTRVEIHLPVPNRPEVIHDSHPDRGRSRDRASRVETSA